jgi:methionine-rich copper-binding protein CopC
MVRFILAAGAAVFLSLTAASPGAFAHANLIRSTIKNNQVFKAGHTPRQVIGTFAEELDPNPGKTWMKVFEGEADHGLVTERQHSTVNFKHPTQITLPLPALSKGKYYLIWYTHSAVDGHVAAGIVYFSVT